MYVVGNNDIEGEKTILLDDFNLITGWSSTVMLHLSVEQNEWRKWKKEGKMNESRMNDENKTTDHPFVCHLSFELNVFAMTDNPSH